MINKISALPAWDEPTAEILKIENLFSAYGGEAQLFRQDGGTLIFLLGKDAIICGKADEEVKDFVRFLRPDSVFSSSDNLKTVFGSFDAANVLILRKPPKLSGNTFSDALSSREAYEILTAGGFLLPPYEYFATDYCRRLNHGLIKVFAKKDLCAAITLESKNYRLLAGIASNRKGLGGALLTRAVSGNKPVLCVAEDSLLPFYTKYGFEPLYKAGYWRK